MLMLVVEKDLGAAVIFFVTYIVMLYVATRRAMWPLMGLAAGAGASVVAYHLFDHVKRRVVAWKDPWGNYNDAGYQIAQSLFAIGTGGWFGMGLCQGKTCERLVAKIILRRLEFLWNRFCRRPKECRSDQ